MTNLHSSDFTLSMNDMNCKLVYSSNQLEEVIKALLVEVKGIAASRVKWLMMSWKYSFEMEVYFILKYIYII